MIRRRGCASIPHACARWGEGDVVLRYFFFSSRRRHTRCLSDWSSDVCSSDLISMTTTVPTLSQDPATHRILEDRNTPRTVTVRLLAIHVVFSLPGHPELVWASRSEERRVGKECRSTWRSEH